MLALGLYVVLTLLLQTGICASQSTNKPPKDASCNSEGDLKLLEPREVNGYTNGVALFCEGGTWRTIHDSNWTVADRTVACRQLGYMYSDQGEVSFVVFHSDEYQFSTKIMQCNGSESTLLDCVVTTTTINIEQMTAVKINCANRGLYSSSKTVTSSILLFSETAGNKPLIMSTSPVPQPSPSPGEPIITTTSKAETATSSFSPPAPSPPTSPPQKATFRTFFIAGILGGLAILIGITVVILSIYIIVTRAKRRANNRKRNSDYSGGTLPLYRDPVYAQLSRVDTTNPHIYHELERFYDVIKVSPTSDQRSGKDAAEEPNNPEPYQKPVSGQSGEGFKPEAQYASLDKSKQYATLEAFTGGTVPNTFTSSGRCTPPNGTYSHLSHSAPAAHPSTSEATGGDPDYSEIPVRPERTHPAKVHSQKGDNQALNNRKSADYAILEPGFANTQWKMDGISAELTTECLYYKQSLNTGGRPQEADRTSSELSTFNGHADLSTTHDE